MLLASKDYRLFFGTTLPMILAVVGAAAWTLVNLLGAAFIAARHAGRLLSVQALVSTAKVLFVLLFAGAGATGIVAAWVASAVLGVVVGVVWLVPKMGLGHRPGFHPRRRATAAADFRLHQHRRPRHRRALAPPT
jgi:O-antigen/teichoic acid export membrane protein